jgi:hypothetical protein
MSSQLKRGLAAIVLAGAAGGGGYALGANAAPAATPVIPVQDVAAPTIGTTRILYSLDAKQNDQQIIALINGAQTHIYFAIYEFTLKDIADALVAAKERGVDVEGLVDASEASGSYDAPIIKELQAAGIPVEEEKHPDGNGIMHIKAIVTDSAYALGSYNWTASATTENDELLEIGTSPDLVAAYTGILQKLLAAYKGNAALSGAASVSIGTISYTDAGENIGNLASVRGTLVDTYTSKSGTVFLDFCSSYKSCPFSGVIFADDVSKFKNLSSLSGKVVTLTGTISSYQGQAEMVLSDPSQLSQ